MSFAELKNYKVNTDNGNDLWQHAAPQRTLGATINGTLQDFQSAERIRYTDGVKNSVSGIGLFEHFFFRINITESNESISLIQVYHFNSTTSVDEDGLRLYTWNVTASGYQERARTQGWEFSDPLNYTTTEIDEMIDENGSLFASVQSNLSSSGVPGSPSVWTSEGFQGDLLSYNIFPSLEGWDSILFETKDDFITIAEIKPQEEAVISGLELYSLNYGRRQGYQVEFDCVMNRRPLDKFSKEFFGNIDYSSTDLLLNFIPNDIVFKRMEQELSVKVIYDGGEHLIPCKGEPLYHLYQHYSVPINGSYTLEYNENLFDVKNVKRTPYYVYKMERLTTNFKPFRIQESGENEDQIITFDRGDGRYLLMLKGFYIPHAYKTTLPIQESLPYFWNAWTNPTYFTDIINRANSINSDSFYVNITYVQDTIDLTPPNVTMVIPGNNSAEYPNNLTAFNYFFTSNNTVINCSLYLDEEINQSHIGNAFDMDQRFNHTFFVNFTEVGEHDFTVGCFSFNGVQGFSLNSTINISFSNFSLTPLEPLEDFASNRTLNETWNASVQLTCLGNDCGRMNLSLRWNRSSTIPDDPINGTFPFQAISKGGLSIFNVLAINQSFGDYKGMEWNGTHLWVIDATNKEILAWNITNFDSPFITETIDITALTPATSCSLTCFSIAWDFQTNSIWFSNGTEVVNIETDGTLIQSCRLNAGVRRMQAMTWDAGFVYVINGTRDAIKVNATDCTTEATFSDLTCVSDCNGLTMINDEFYTFGSSIFGTAVYNKTFDLLYERRNFTSELFTGNGGSMFDGFYLYVITEDVLTKRNAFNPVNCRPFAFKGGESCTVNWTVNSTFENSTPYFIDFDAFYQFGRDPNEILRENDTTEDIQINPPGAPPPDTCGDIGTTGLISCSDGCIFNTVEDANGNDLVFTDLGLVQVLADIINWASVTIINQCVVHCNGGCFV